LQRDVLSAGKGIVTARAGLPNALCFFQLSQSLTQFTSELLRLQTLVLIADDMHDPYDGKAVLSQVKDVSAALLKTIEADRPSVNRVPSNCPTNNFVAVKAPGIAESVCFCGSCPAHDRQPQLVLGPFRLGRLGAGCSDVDCGHCADVFLSVADKT
jgi:hypothetical protein